MSDCLFCKIEKGDIPAEKVYDDDSVFAISDINPQAPVHLLIIPKKHYSTILELDEKDQELVGSVFSATNCLAKDYGLDQSGFRVVVNCGAEAGQSVFHVHYHLLGGRAMHWPPG
ncbi:MAG: histidine triad nucleotide-binding protein [Nitrospinaceae bacterium]|nr:histidine triad nucleotide-binding protein [Nitrospinaceae bacterium]